MTEYWFKPKKFGLGENEDARRMALALGQRFELKRIVKTVVRDA
jgi:hypothetical protein